MRNGDAMMLFRSRRHFVTSRTNESARDNHFEHDIPPALLLDDQEQTQTSGGSRISQKGAPTPKVGSPTYYLTNFFPENCMKMKEFGLRGGSCVPGAPPLGSANADLPEFCTFLSVMSVNKLMHVTAQHEV